MTGGLRVLYGEDNPLDADLTVARLSACAPDLALEIVGTGAAVLARLGEGAFDVVLLDHHLPDMEGLEVLQRLVHAGVAVPVVLVTGVGNEELVVKALRLGAADYVPKNGDYLETLPSLVRGVVEEHRQRLALGVSTFPAPRRILYVEHLRMDAELTLQHFAEAAPHFAVQVVTSCGVALERLAQDDPYDLVLLDLRMPDMSGLDFVRQAKRSGLELPPFIMVSGKGDDAAAIATLRLGAANYVAKRDGYLDQLVASIDQTIATERQRRLNLRLQAELAERARAEAALRKSETWHRVLFDESPDALMTLAPPSWTFTSGNAAAIALFGARDAADFTSRTPWQCSPPLQPDDRPSVDKALELLESALVRGSASYEWVYERRSGESFAASVRLARVALEGQPLLQATVRDETEFKALQARLAQADRLASLGTLAAGVAHEINNPLTALLANLQLAQRAITAGRVAPAGPALDDLRSLLGQAHEAADMVKVIVRDLKLFARPDQAQPVAVDVDKVLASSLRLAATEVKQRARVVTAYGEVPPVLGSEPRLGQVFLNLLVNAAQAMPEGRMHENVLRVATRKLDDGRVAVEISDTGHGIAPGALEHLFTPFFTTKAAGGGTGLGLAVSHRIVTDLGGEIQVETELGRGTTFRVALRAASTTAAAPEVAPGPGGGDRQRARIVVIDDDPIVLSTLRRVLAAEHEVLTFTRAAEALEHVRAGASFDVILCDLMMPQMTGMEFHAALRALRPDVADRVVFMTGGAFTDAARDFLRSVPNPRLEKPFDIDGLLAMVDAALARTVRV